MLQKLFVMLFFSGAMVGSSIAGVPFEEDFDDSGAAAARFDATENLGWVPSPDFHDGVVTLKEYSGGTTTIRTNAANNFVDDGSSGPVVYSVVMDRQDGAAGGVFNSLYARLGASDFADGYQVRYLCDSTADAGYSTSSLQIFRVVSGVKDKIYDSGTMVPAPVTFVRTAMLLTLENKADSVDYALEFGAFSCSGSDTSVDRIENGVGVGIELMSTGGLYFVPTDYDNLKVEDFSLGCADLVAMGSTLPADFNKDCYVDLLDFAIITQNWSRCANPQDDNCE